MKRKEHENKVLIKLIFMYVSSGRLKKDGKHDV